jgi:hypothetical protein
VVPPEAGRRSAAMLAVSLEECSPPRGRMAGLRLPQPSSSLPPRQTNAGRNASSDYFVKQKASRRAGQPAPEQRL